MPIKKIKEQILKLKKNDWRNESRAINFTNEFKHFKKSFRENFVTLIISSLGLLVALTWNGFWNAWVSTLTIENTISYKFYIALGMTIFAVMLTYVFSKLKGE